MLKGFQLQTAYMLANCGSVTRRIETFHLKASMEELKTLLRLFSLNPVNLPRHGNISKTRHATLL